MHSKGGLFFLMVGGLEQSRHFWGQHSLPPIPPLSRTLSFLSPTYTFTGSDVLETWLMWEFGKAHSEKAQKAGNR